MAQIDIGQQVLGSLVERHEMAIDKAAQSYERLQMAKKNNWPDVAKFEDDLCNAWQFASGIFDAIQLVKRKLEGEIM